MKKIRPVVLVSFAVLLGAIVASCLSFSSNPATGGQGGTTGTNLGGTTGTTDLGGTTGTTDLGGTTGTTDLGGTTGTTNLGGTTGTTNLGGVTGTGAGGSNRPGTGGATGSGGATAASGPCDVLAAAGNPCVAAHSTVRALYGSYNKPLYQVCRGASQAGPNSCLGTTSDIGVVAGGYANSAAQDTFCAGSSCTISIIYDQSPNGNHLHPAPAGGPPGPDPDLPANAADLKITINGHSVYGVFSKPGMGYRAGCTGCGTPVPVGTATGDQPETEYMVTSQNGLVDGCCFDYGNAEVDSHDDGNGTMQAVYFGGGVVWDTGNEGPHSDTDNPWVMADLENGLFAGFDTTVLASAAQKITSNTSLKFPFVTALIVGDTADKNAGKGRFAIYGADATTGPLKQMYDGIRPTLGGYVPMDARVPHRKGSIILGIGGDNSKRAGGQFFEGVMATGAATLATVNAVQANIVAARYGK
jgi:hypothetical protein